jgi:hypothetical protein
MKKDKTITFQVANQLRVSRDADGHSNQVHTDAGGFFASFATPLLYLASVTEARAAEVVKRWNEHEALAAVADAVQEYFIALREYRKRESNAAFDTLGLREDELRLKMDALDKLRKEQATQ